MPYGISKKKKKKKKTKRGKEKRKIESRSNLESWNSFESRRGGNENLQRDRQTSTFGLAPRG